MSTSIQELAEAISQSSNTQNALDAVQDATILHGTTDARNLLEMLLASREGYRHTYVNKAVQSMAEGMPKDEAVKKAREEYVAGLDTFPGRTESWVQ